MIHFLVAVGAFDWMIAARDNTSGSLMPTTSERRVYLEASVSAREFPLDENGNPEVRFPTRLGNLITAFETYPLTRYGMDAIFFWPRIWLQLDKDTREAIDGSQALADSAVYSSFALAMAGAAWWTSAALRVVGFHPVQLLGLQSAVDVPNARWAVLIGTMLTCAAYAMYRGALFANAQFGEIFKAVFDVHASRFDHFSRDIMNVDAIIDEVGSTLRDWSIRDLAPRDKLTIAWRYLHNFRVKCPTCGKVIPVPAFRAHVAKEHEP